MTFYTAPRSTVTKEKFSQDGRPDSNEIVRFGFCHFCLSSLVFFSVLDTFVFFSGKYWLANLPFPSESPGNLTRRIFLDIKPPGRSLSNTDRRPKLMIVRLLNSTLTV